MDARRITAVEAMEIYGDGHGALDLQAWHDTQDILAWIVESGEIERALQHAVRVFGVPWFEDAFASLDPAAHGVRVTTSGGRVMQANLLVGADGARRSEEHTSELQSLMRISYAVLCLKKKNRITDTCMQPDRLSA